jgi:hypothetical protein
MENDIRAALAVVDELTPELDRRLAQARPDRYAADDMSWAQPVNDWYAGELRRRLTPEQIAAVSALEDIVGGLIDEIDDIKLDEDRAAERAGARMLADLMRQQGVNRVDELFT